MKRSSAGLGLLAGFALTASQWAVMPTHALGDEVARGKILTLPEVIQRVLEHDPKNQVAQARLDEAVATRQSALGNYGPRLQVDGTLFYWNEPHDVVAVNPSSLDLSGVPSSLLPLLGQLAKPIRFRDERTAQLQVTVVQPITPLYSVHQGQSAAHEGELAAGHQQRQNQREATFRATESYYRLLAARHLLRVAEQAATTLQAHVDQAKQFRDADLIGRDDYLAAEVELGNAVENRIKAKTQGQLAEAALATMMGHAGETGFSLADIPEDAEPPLPPSLDKARENGLGHRAEIATLEALTRASAKQAKMAWWQLTPQISGMARYQRTSGNAMSNPNEWFVGGALSWNLWDWGATYFKARAAEAQVRQARARIGDAKDLIDLEINQRFLAIEAARERLNVARMTLRQAEEAMRIARMKFEQRTVPSTTVLDSQTRLSRAQASRIQAQYDLILAVAALRLSMGDGLVATVLPDELLLAQPR